MATLARQDQVSNYKGCARSAEFVGMCAGFGASGSD